MNVILHADDFGFDNDTLDATIECFEKGALSSCSIMVNCDASERAFEYAKNHSEFSYGVHLTYVDGLKPVLAARNISSLVGSNGGFLMSNQVRKKAMLFKLSRNEVVAESQAQIDKAEKAGVAISHLDSHGHLHKFPSILYSMKYLKIGGSPIKRVRCVQNIFVKEPSKKSPGFWLNQYFRWYLNRHFVNPHYFFMSANNMDIGWADNIIAQMEELPQEGVIEIGVHPGHKEDWRRHEYDDIIDFAAKLRKCGKHQIINWNHI